jgi:hypothetical protein
MFLPECWVLDATKNRLKESRFFDKKGEDTVSPARLSPDNARLKTHF